MATCDQRRLEGRDTAMQTKALRVGIVQWFSISCVLTGCATSQELTSVREDVQKELQESRSAYDRAMAKAEASRKVSEESQVRLAADLKNQEQQLSALTQRMQDLQVRQEYAVKERASTQETNRALREAILHALKTEQADLQQRITRVNNSIAKMEQSQAMPPVGASGAGQPAAVEAPKPDKPMLEHEPGQTPSESTRTK